MTCSVVADRNGESGIQLPITDIERARLAANEDDPEERAALQDDGMEIPDFLIRPLIG